MIYGDEVSLNRVMRSLNLWQIYLYQYKMIQFNWGCRPPINQLKPERKRNILQRK